MNDSLRRSIMHHVFSTFPEEACGVIDQDGRYLRLTNIHPDPQNHFRVDPEEQRRIIENGFNLKAIVHSHTHADAKPSSIDRRLIELYPDLVHIIISVETGEVRAWEWDLTKEREVPIP